MRSCLGSEGLTDQARTRLFRIDGVYRKVVRAGALENDVIDLGNNDIIENLGTFNVILGKNGSGKSTLLRRMDNVLSSKNGFVRYITPERGGVVRYEGNIETNLANNPDFLSSMRRNNQYDQFRQSSANEFRNLETLVLRTIERDKDIRSSEFKFEDDIQILNGVLDRVYLVNSNGAGFDILRRSDNAAALPQDLSSGESELISLSIEISYFSYQCKLDKYRESENWLLFDEPDVHLHPDLQDRLMQLLYARFIGTNAKVAIATHSTAIVSGLRSLSNDVRVAFKEAGVPGLKFRNASLALQKILPVFGAHPLSNVFNKVAPLIVEGEDDERIWQSAVRRSMGRISVFPCVAGDIQSLNEFEKVADELLGGVYENARVFSLRDRDDSDYPIDNVGRVIRSRLNCRTAENLILTDDCLSELGTDWRSMLHSLEIWIESLPGHPRHQDIVDFRDSGWDRRNFNLKPIRMVLVGQSGSDKPWEIAVGQAIARMPEHRFDGVTSMEYFLGPKIAKEMNLI